MRKFYIALLALLMVSGSVMAQGTIIRGQVIDAKSGEPVPGATVKFMDFRDTTDVTYAATDMRGFFQVEGMRPRGLKLVITSVGYEPLTQMVRNFGEDQDLGSLKLVESTKLLADVEVQGTAVRSEQKGDTTVYRADAYQTMADASAEDLVGKMPGMVVQNGSVQAQGETVQQVLVDGRRFFSTDPSQALKSLPAEVIDRIEVYDQLSEQSQFSGFDDGDRQKTLNLVTRADARQGQFGKVYAGYGFEDKYKAGGSLNFFSGDRRISIIGQANNINQQNFSSEDILGVTSGSSGGRGRGGRGGSGSNFMVGQQNGISLTNALGINYSDSWGEKTKVEASYFFNHRNNVTEQLLQQTYLAGAGEGQVYDESTNSTSTSFNHRMNMRLEYSPSRTNSFVWTPSVRLQSSALDDMLFGETFLNADPLNSTTTSTNVERSGYTLSNSLLWRHRFSKFGRTLSVNFTGGLDNDDGQTDLFAANQFFVSGSSVADTLNQRAVLNNLGYNLGANVSFTEAITRTQQLSVDLSTNYRLSNYEEYTNAFEELTQAFSRLDSALSTDFTNGYWTQRAGLSWRNRTENGMVMVRANYQLATLDGEQLFPYGLNTSYTFHNILPFVMWRMGIGDDKNITLMYRTNTQEPSATQLAPVVDNTNPLQWSVGNPNLQQTYSHSMFARFSASEVEKGQTFFAMLGGGLTENYITQTTFLARKDTTVSGVYLPAGQQVSMPVNLNGYWNLRGFVTYGLPIKPLKSNLNLNVGLTYAMVPGQINGVDNVTGNTTATGGLVLSSNISDRVDFTLGTTSNYTVTTNALQPTLSTTLLNQVSSVRFNWAITDAIIYRTNFTHQLYQGLSSDLDQQVALWNMSLGYRFLKDRRGELALEVFDALNQNTSLQRNVTDIYIEDVQTNVLQRYFMLTFTYNLRAFGNVPQVEERPGMPPGGFHGGRPGGGRGFE